MPGMRYQPQGRAQVAKGSAYANGLLCAVTPHSRMDAWLGRPYTQDGTYAQASSPVGLGLQTNGSSSAIWLPIENVALTRFTLFGIFRSSSAAVDTRALALGSSSNSSPIVQIGTGSSNATKVRLFARTDSFVTSGEASSTADAFDGKLHSVALMYDGSNLICYIDGKLDSSNSLNSATFTVDRFCVGALRRSATGQFWSGSTYFAAAWSRTLSAREVAGLHENAWRMFIAPEEVDDVVAAATGVSPGVGSVAISGAAPTVSRTANQAFTAGVGSASLTGYAPIVSQMASTTLVPGVGPVAISGHAPTVTQPRVLAVGSGAMSFTGHAPNVTITNATSLVPGFGQMTIAGPAPTINQSASQYIGASGGAMLVAGHAPVISMTSDYVRAPDGGGYVPRRNEASARPAQHGGSRPPAIQGNDR